MASTKPTRSYPSIPSPGADLSGHASSVQAIKECIEIHERRTRDIRNSFVRLGELIDLHLVSIQGDQILPYPISEFADDAAAAQGGVPIGGLYRVGNVVQVRIA